MIPNLENIEKYLRNELSPEDRAEFEKLISNDADLENQVEAHRVILLGIEQAFHEELKETLQEIEEHLPTEGTTRNLFRPISIAATLVLIAGAVYFIWLASSPEIFDEYYQTYPNVVSPAERSNGNLNDPFVLYEEGNYREALDQLAQTDPETPESIFYTAMCHIELGELKPSEEELRRILELPENKFKTPARWYLSLVLIKDGKKKEARKFLEILSENENTYGVKSRQILEIL